MTGDDEEATELVRDRRNFGARFAEVVAYSVPQSDRFPEGVKYSMQYGNLETGETIVRYDNFPDHPGAAHHHKHDEDGVTDVDYRGLEDLYERFIEEVESYGEEWD